MKETKDHIVHVRMPTSLVDEIDAQAEEESVTRSAMIRELLRRGLAVASLESTPVS